LQQRHGFLERIIARLDLFGRSLILFSWLMCHNSSLVLTARPRSADLPLSVFEGHLKVSTFRSEMSNWVFGGFGGGVCEIERQVKPGAPPHSLQSGH
jgi:hypothetical protein